MLKRFSSWIASNKKPIALASANAVFVSGIALCGISIWKVCPTMIYAWAGLWTALIGVGLWRQISKWDGQL